MKRSKVIEIAKEILEGFNEQIKKYELDLYDQTQVLRTAASIIDEEASSVRFKKMNAELLKAIKRGEG